MEKIIIIEDDETIREEFKSLLEKYRYEVVAPNEFEDIIGFVLAEKADLILLDVNLPIYDGYYICKEIRKKSEIPIIIVTSRNTDADELMSMNLGADDFVSKPYNVQILIARINSLLKRSGANIAETTILTHRDVRLNLSNASLRYKNKEVELTKNEMKILSYLIENKGNIISRSSLMEYLWSSDYFVDDSALSVNVTRIRKKMKEIGIENLIETKRGLGYIIQ